MPEPGELLWCKHCREYMECALIEEYRARCLDCTYSRRYGTAELTAKTKGTVHALKNMHTVVITKGDDEVERISPKVTQEILGDSPIPY